MDVKSVNADKMLTLTDGSDTYQSHNVTYGAFSLKW